jgi:deoxyribodipyrimidine photo-lyase
MPVPPPPQTVLTWFRDDLRVADNPALAAASAEGRPLVALYLLDDETPEEVRPLGAAARWWLHHALASLSDSLEARGSRLILRRGRAENVLPALAHEAGATAVYWNRRYGAAAAVDARVENALTAAGIRVDTHKANLLFEPDEIVSRAGKPFQVYSAFWRAALGHSDPRPPLPAPANIPSAGLPVTSDSLDSLNLLPRSPDWAGGIRDAWQPGEAAAMNRLKTFVEDGLSGYAGDRDMPAADGSSRLSPHLRFGEISPFQVRHAATGKGKSAAKFLAEIGWREFSYHLLGQFPALAEKNLKPAFDDFPWAKPTRKSLSAWQDGRTGYPIVDAGMRQLWQTGWMHNRVRMVVASFLIKHLLLDWRIGEAWFWDTLVDADPANNSASWQWVAGSGADAQPYFRIFNPVLQGEKFDPDGAYVRAFVPEIAGLPDRFIHRPWQASPVELGSAGVALGTTYPEPIVDHATARQRALAAYEKMRQAAGS